MHVCIIADRNRCVRGIKFQKNFLGCWIIARVTEQFGMIPILRQDPLSDNLVLLFIYDVFHFGPARQQVQIGSMTCGRQSLQPEFLGNIP